MKINLMKNNGENYLAVFLTLVVIGLLFVLKTQEDDSRSIDNNTIRMESTVSID